ncbi:unnamed protein product (macronuclear) [Paramecium tetraurelia]|uniref:Uncharacterized protein n=1 Tax=Paramecium tetraurelia TaxID=5888 RepID=A0CYN0_PARTE|nr:uncharacterized protein GSPATT00011498001 [Paramecium tetraurelia]CAK75897.1 unnamed protein product [Paramecium tetraurelia]|eukprot:XP_001443294.1 hypothetical protein (macronuclear) [Paramecium tetraurelia strain d4-2]
MQKRKSHNKLPTEIIHPNNCFIMPKSIRTTQTSSQNIQVQKFPSSNNIDDSDQIYRSEIIMNHRQSLNLYKSNLESALHYSDINQAQLQRINQQLLQNNIDLQVLYNKSEQENKQLQNELTNFKNRISLKEIEFKQTVENNAQYMKEIAQLKIQMQKLNQTLNKLSEENNQLKEKFEMNQNFSNSLSQIQGLSSRREGNQQNDCNLSGSIISQNSRIKTNSFSNTKHNISDYQTQIISYQNQVAEKNQLILGLQSQVRNLTEVQRQLMSPKKKYINDSQDFNLNNPTQTPIENSNTQNESNIGSNIKLLNLINDPKNQDSTIHRTIQSDEIDGGPSIKSSITNLKSKQELSKIYKKINQSTIYTAGLYSSLLDYQYLSNNKLLSASSSKEFILH